MAIKIPHPEMESEPVLFERFQREQISAQKLDHPGVMKVFADQERGRNLHGDGVGGRPPAPLHFEGREEAPAGASYPDHHRHLRSARLHPQPWRCTSRSEAGKHHGRTGGHIKLIDFGIAGQEGARRLTFAKLSKSMGTPDYISPEQVKGKRGDGRSDIYAAGVMLYEMLTGEVPFKGPNPFAIMNDRLLNNPVPPRELDPTISPQLQEIIYRAIERDPATATRMPAILRRIWSIRIRWACRKTAWNCTTGTAPLACLQKDIVLSDAGADSRGCLRASILCR